MALADGAQNTPMYVSEAVEVELSQVGIDLAVAEIRRSFLAEELTGVLDNIEDRKYGVDIEVSGMTYRIKVNDLAVVAVAEGLKLRVVIDHAIANAERIVFKKKVITTIRSTCKDTEVRIGEEGTITLEVLLDARVNADGHVVLQERNVRLPVPEDQYKVKGPRSCSGDLGIGSLIKFAVNKILDQARKKVEGALGDRIRDMMPGLSQSIDAQLHQTLPFDLAAFPTLPAKKLSLTTRPTSLTISPNKLHVVMGAAVEEIGPSEYERLLVDSYEELSWLEKVASSDRFGTVGVNPDLANVLFKVVTPTQPEFFELSPDLSPQMGEFLNRGTLATIWPDLNAIDNSDYLMRAFVSLPRSPRIQLQNTSGTVTLRLLLEDFHLTFFVNRSGTWQRYSHLHIGVDAPVKVGIIDGVLKVGAGLAAVSVEGSFDPSYIPRVPIFEKDMAEVVVRTIFDVLTEQGLIAVVDVPKVPVGGEILTVDGFKVMEPFLQLDLVRAPR